MKKLLSVVIALMMMVTFVFAEEAAPAEVKTLYAGVLTVGCEAGYPPFEMVADDGESVVGLDMDIMAAVAEKLGLQMQVVTTSFDGIFDGIGVNYDVVCSAVTITPDRMQNMLCPTSPTIRRWLCRRTRTWKSIPSWIWTAMSSGCRRARPRTS